MAPLTGGVDDHFHPTVRHKMNSEAQTSSKSTPSGRAACYVARDDCEHDWQEVEGLALGRYRVDVRCTLCGCTGERDERDGSVEYPTT